MKWGAPSVWVTLGSKYIVISCGKPKASVRCRSLTYFALQGEIRRRYRNAAKGNAPCLSAWSGWESAGSAVFVQVANGLV